MTKQLHRRIKFRNSTRYGGEKAWKQHREDGWISGIVKRQAADQRFMRSLMQETDDPYDYDCDIDLPFDWFDYFGDDDYRDYACYFRQPPMFEQQRRAVDRAVGDRTPTFNLGANLRCTVDVAYNSAGKIVSARTRLHRRNS